MTSLFLSHEELIELTGYKTAEKQKSVLRRQRIAYVEDAYKRPKVMRSVLEKRFDPKKDREEPDYAAIARQNLMEMRANGAL